MYCKKCGYKLRTGENVCKNCGEPAGSAEYCGGFWGIVGEDKKPSREPESIMQENVLSSSALQKGGELSEKKSAGRIVSGGRNRLWASFGICGVLLVLLVAQSFRLSAVSDDSLEKKREYDELQGKYYAVVQENKDLLERIDELSEYILKIKEHLIMESEKEGLSGSNSYEDNETGENLTGDYEDANNEIEDESSAGKDVWRNPYINNATTAGE